VKLVVLCYVGCVKLSGLPLLSASS
jgi:hypothetical protein